MKEKGQGGPESAPNSQREGTPPQEHGRPQEWSHEALVKRYQNIVQKNLSKLGKYYSAEEIIRIEIERDIFAAEKNSEACNGGELAFYNTILNAWDALTYERYVPGGANEREAGRRLQSYYRDEALWKLGGFELGAKTICLYEREIWVIDALTEALGIPHQKGQREIEIPEKLRHYDKYTESRGYKELVAKADLERINKLNKPTK